MMMVGKSGKGGIVVKKEKKVKFVKDPLFAESSMEEEEEEERSSEEEFMSCRFSENYLFFSVV